MTVIYNLLVRCSKHGHDHRLHEDCENPVGRVVGNPIVTCDMVKQGGAVPHEQSSFCLNPRRWNTHSTHGRGTAEGGPDDSDCGCRGTVLEAACAEGGCGFCRRAVP